MKILFIFQSFGEIKFFVETFTSTPETYHSTQKKNPEVRLHPQGQKLTARK